MICAKPIHLLTGDAVPCGQCMNCRINKQRKWLGRLLLESTDHEWASFVTLTYSEEHVPWTVDRETGHRHHSLQKSDVQKWLKRLRFTISQNSGRTLRFYGCGEYGTGGTSRPHYHLIMFGIACTETNLIRDTWGLGHITISEANQKNMRYTAKYTLKKMLKDPEQLHGRQPEYSMMSRRPPLGSTFVRNIADSLRTKSGSHALAYGRVEKQVRIGKTRFPLDRTMMKHLMDEMDIPADAAKIAFVQYDMSPPTPDEQKAAQASNAKALRRAGRETQNPIL